MSAAEPTGATPAHPAHGATCASCAVALDGRLSFWLRARAGLVRKCTRCSLLDAALLGRSARIAAVVGSFLVALNQGDALLSGTFAWSTGWYKLPLTYVVPFSVATYGALSNGRQRDG